MFGLIPLVFVCVSEYWEISDGFHTARFMIQWCAPDPTSDDYIKAIVDTSRAASQWMNLPVLSSLRVRSIPKPDEVCS